MIPASYDYFTNFMSIDGVIVQHVSAGRIRSPRDASVGEMARANLRNYSEAMQRDFYCY
jgi:hypothetical protein